MALKLSVLACGNRYSKQHCIQFIATMKLSQLLFCLSFISISCKGGDENPKTGDPRPVERIKYDESHSIFKSYKGLVMAGYQGWFTAEGDGAGRGWHHYQKAGKFEPGFASIDFWPDVTEYHQNLQHGIQICQWRSRKGIQPLPTRKAWTCISNG